MGEASPRLGLPMLAAGQAQKEIYHNEALTILDALIQPVAETLGDNAPPPSPAEGQSWIVGANPADGWEGHAGALATWSGGGWRFAAPMEGMTVRVRAVGLDARWGTGAWSVGTVQASGIEIGGLQVVGSRQEAIADPTGGSTADGEARSAIASILSALRNHGLIAA